jgi:hypothetical protein
MTWRRNVHIDCDLVGKGPGDMGALLGRALQASLYWLAENAKRRVDTTDIYVGRVGDSKLYLAYRRGQTITLASVTANLQQAAAGAQGFSIPLYDADDKSAAEADVRNYFAAVNEMFGEKQARRFDLSTAPTEEKQESATPFATGSSTSERKEGDRPTEGGSQEDKSDVQDDGFGF